MKKSLFVFSALTVSFTTSLSAQAQSSADTNPQLGTGGDNAARQEFRQKMLQRFDANHDGELDDSERAQMHEMMQKRRLQEQNEGVRPGGGLGAAGAGDIQAGQGFGQHGGAGFSDQQRQEHKQKMLQKFDANHDGQLDDNERAQMKQFMELRRQQREQGGFGGPNRAGRPEGPPLDGPDSRPAGGGPLGGPGGGPPAGGAAGGPPLGPEGNN